MGKGGGSAEVEINKYFLSQHFGICAGADALLALTIKEKEAWTGNVTTQSEIVIDKPALFGASEKEGGLEGVVHYLPGASDQLLSDLLAQKLGRPSGASCPGYRGLASIFFTGPRGTENDGYSGWGDQTRGKRGFYWTANNPYLPGVWATVKRAPVGLNPDLALIPDVAESDGPLEMIDLSDTFGELEVGDVGYPTPGNFHPNTLTLGPYAQDVQFVAATHLPADNRWYFNGVQWAGPLYYGLFIFSGTVIGTLEAGETFTIQVKNLNDPRCFGSGQLSVIGLGSDPRNANPAHIIYECLTNTDWGMGSPDTSVDISSFETAAVTLYGELFGLSMIWTRQSSIQDFIQEVLDHIQAVVFVDPATGLLTLKLIRGDYDADTLDEINPQNAELTSFGRKLWGEIINEVVVTWTNPENEQDETVVVQDLASIVTQGGIISDGRNYYGVRNAALAQRLAQRDLRSAGAPLASCEAEVDRTLWQVRPASVYRLVWPEYGLAGVVMRVTDVNYGRPGDPTIKLTLVEDVFGLDVGDYVEPPGTVWKDPSSDPAPLQHTQILTLPYFMAARSGIIDSPEYPEVVAGVLGNTADEDTFNYELWDEVAQPDSSLAWQALRTENVIGRAELASAFSAEAETTFDETFDLTTLTGQTAPAQGGFMLIGDGSEAENEIALVTGVGATVTVSRGVLDTVPRDWPVGTPVWFIDGSTLCEDPLVRAAGEVVSYRMLTRTSQGLLDLEDAPDVSYTLTERPWLPSRPANVAVAGVLFNTAADPVDMTLRPNPWVTVGWSNRNRVMEDSQVLGWTEATVTPETGQTTTIEVLDDDGLTVLDTISGISGTSYDVPDASFGAGSVVLIRPKAARTDADGTFASLQGHGIWVQVAPSRVTEVGENRLSEGGLRRELED